MDLTIPYTFYPIALPHWIAWTLFLVSMLCGAAVGVARGMGRAGCGGPGSRFSVQWGFWPRR